jgi:alpha-mannosidase
MKTIHLVGNAHIDPAWLWRWTDGLAEIKATFRAAVDRLKEFDEFVFTCAGASYYRWVEETEPKLFAEIRDLVRAKRWIIVGGWWLQPDCNLPCGESFVRHSLYGQRYFREKFGVLCTVGYNVDSFGHNGMIPQILKRSGMDAYVFMRPGPHENGGIEKSLFWWESPDGSRVLAFRIPYSYNSSYNRSGHNDEKKLPAVLDLAESEGLDFMYFFGVGNHGGGPTIKAMRQLMGLRERLAGRAEVRFSSPAAYFRQVLEKKLDGLQVIRSDLQHHASGCYSAHSEIKRNNRRAESALLLAESAGVFAELVAGHETSRQALGEAWKAVLWNQFHDIMGGCCIKAAYDDARALHGEAIATADREFNAAFQKVSWGVDTAWVAPPLSKDGDWILWEREGAGVPVVVFNPHGWPVRTALEVNAVFSRAVDPEGCPIPLQQIRGPYANRDRKKATLLSVDLPAWGYRVFRAFAGAGGKGADDSAEDLAEAVRAGDFFLENGRLRVELDPDGNVRHLLDKGSGLDYLADEGTAFVVIDETHCDTWSHGVFTFDREMGRFTGTSVRVIESGPVRARIRATQRYENSELTLDYTLLRGERALAVECRLLWLEKHRMLKLYLPVSVRDPAVLYSMPFGCIEKSADGQEEPAQKWILLQGRDEAGRELGVALLNREKHSYSAPGARLTMTLVRSPQYADHFAERDDLADYIDIGGQEISFRILPFSGPAPIDELAKAAELFNTPPQYVVETYHEGPLPLQMQGIEVMPAHVLISAVKKQEDGQGYVVRCYEAAGQSADALVRMPLLGRDWRFAVAPHQIRTFCVPADPDSPVRETNLLEL